MGKKFILAWVFLVLAAIAIYYQFSYQQKIGRDLRREAQSLQALALIYELENNLAATESAAGCYVLSAREEQLKKYRACTEEIRRLLTELTSTTRETPKQQQLLRLLQTLINGTIALLDRRVELRQGQGFDAAAHPALAGSGRQLSDRLRQVLGNMEDEEKKRLNPRWAQQIDLAHTMVLASTIVILVSVSVLFLISYLFALEERRRRESEAKLQTSQKDLQTMASQLSLAEESERQRLRVQLHDHIGQSLALANIKLGELLAAANPIPGSRPDRLLEVRRLLEHAIHETQSLTFTISSPILHEIGLEAALAWLTETSLREHGIAPFFESDDQPKPVAKEVAILLYQIVAELLANVVKHAQARHVKVSLWLEEDRLQVEVDDDGVGLDVRDLGSWRQGSTGYGLFCTRERLAPFGGTVTVNSLPGEGTQVTVSVPLETSASLSEAS